MYALDLCGMFLVVGCYRDDSSAEKNLPEAFPMLGGASASWLQGQAAGQGGRASGITDLRRRRETSETMGEEQPCRQQSQ